MKPEATPLSAPELQRRAISGSVWTAVHTVVSVPVAFAANAVIARELGVEHFGELAFLTALLTLALQFANLGFSPALVQWGSAAEARGARGEAATMLRRSLGFHTSVELPILTALVIVVTRGDPWWVGATAVAGVAGACILSGAALSVTIENRTAANARVAIGTNLLTQAAMVSVAVATGSAAAVWATRAAMTALALLPVLSLLPPERRLVVLRPRWPRGFPHDFWRFAAWTWIGGLVALLVFSRSEIFLLKAFDKQAGLAVFALAFGISQQLTAPTDAMLHALLPAVAGVLSAWPERAAAAFDRATRVSALACGAITAVVVPLLVFLTPLVYGGGFSSAAWLLVPLALVSCLQSVNNPITAFATARRRARLIFAANAAALVVDVGVAVAFIPLFGAWGAVVANVVGQLVALGILAWTEPLVRGGRERVLARAYRPFAISAVLLGGSLLIGTLVRDWSTVAAALAACGAGGLAYVVALRISGSGLTVADRDALAGALSARSRSRVIRLLDPLTVGTRSA